MTDACPKCDSSSFNLVSAGGHTSYDRHTEKYRCCDCAHRFETPNTRDRKSSEKCHGLSGSAKKLFDANPEDWP